MTEAEKIKLLEEQIVEVDNSPTAGIREKIDLMNELAWLLRDKDTIRSLELGQNTYALAESDSGSGLPYQEGLAYSLRTQGYLNQRLGNHSLSFVQLMNAQVAFRSLDIYDGLSDVYGGIADIYFQIGNFPDALVWIYRQLDTAQQIGDKRLVADAYNNLAKVYIHSEDYEQAEPTLDQSLKFALESGHTRIVCLSYLDIAEIHLQAGRYQEALEFGLRGLDLSREAGFELFEIHSLDILGKIYLKLGDREEGLKNLKTALVLSREIDSKLAICKSLLSFGRANLELQQPDLAIESLKQGLSIAHSIHASVEVYKAHQALSEAYEQTGEISSALQHYKQFRAIEGKAIGDKANLRTKILQIDHQTESAKKEAEIAHLRTVELQNNIREKEEAQQRLQRQLEYARALSDCSRTLISRSDSEHDFHSLLAQALQHLIEPSRAGSIYLLENIEDPKMGFSSRVVCRTYASDSLLAADNQEGLANYRETFLQLSSNDLSDAFQPQTDIIPWSLFSADIPQQLASGVPVSISTKELLEANPLWGEFLSDALHIHSVQYFPIVIADRWWGTLSFDDRIDERLWDVDELMMLQAATEIVKSSLQRQQAHVELRSLNNQLEQMVEDRTTELRDTIKKLSKEVGERERAESTLQEMMDSLEQRVIARTNELATFFDLILMAGQGIDLSEIFEYVVSRLMDFTGSQSVVIDLVEADGDAMYMIAQSNLPEGAPARVYISKFPPELQRWMQGASEPFLTADLARDIPSFNASFDLQDFPYQTYLGAQIRVGDRIDGILSCFRTERGGYSVDTVALVTAVAHQLGLILEINHLRQMGRSMAVMEERERLARELHDSVAQKLYSLNLFAHAGQDAAEDGDLEGVQLRLHQVEENVLDALREMRLMLYQLRPTALAGYSLASAIDERFDLVERRLGIAATVQTDFLPELADEVEEQLFYIISEALNNSLKHAQATQVKVDFASKDGQLMVKVQDNGRGFDPKGPYSGLGMENMCSRADRIDGLITLETAVGQGTTIRILL